MNKHKFALNYVGMALFLFLLAPGTSLASSTDGIQALLAVAQNNAERANESAVSSAAEMRRSIKSKGKLATVEDRRQLTALDENAKRLAKLAEELRQMQARIKADCP